MICDKLRFKHPELIYMLYSKTKQGNFYLPDIVITKLFDTYQKGVFKNFTLDNKRINLETLKA